MNHQRRYDWLSSYRTEQRKNRSRSYFNGQMATADFCHLRLEQNRIFLRIFIVPMEFENGTTASRIRNNGNVMLKPGVNVITSTLTLTPNINKYIIPDVYSVFRLLSLALYSHYYGGMYLPPYFFPPQHNIFFKKYCVVAGKIRWQIHATIHYYRV